MKVIRNSLGYRIYLTDTEMLLLRRMVDIAESAPDVLDRKLCTGLRRSYSRRCGPKRDKDFLRLDIDRRYKR